MSYIDDLIALMMAPQNNDMVLVSSSAAAWHPGAVFDGESGLSLVSGVEDIPFSGTSEYTRCSPTGEYVCITTTSGTSYVYRRSADNLLRVAALPTARGCSWNWSGEYLALAITASPYIAVYRRSGDTFTLLTAPASNAPTSNCVFAEFVPGTNLILTGGNASANFRFFSHDTGAVYHASTPTPPSNIPQVAGWSPDGNTLVVQGSSGGAVAYSRSGVSLSSISITSYAINPTSIRWSPDGLFVSISGSGTGRRLFRYFGGTFTEYTLPTMSSGATQRATWSQNSSKIYFFGIVSSNLTLTIVQRDASDIFTLLSTTTITAATSVYSADLLVAA